MIIVNSFSNFLLLQASQIPFILGLLKLYYTDLPHLEYIYLSASLSLSSHLCIYINYKIDEIYS